MATTVEDLVGHIQNHCCYTHPTQYFGVVVNENPEGQAA
jgi:hypothetical protein